MRKKKELETETDSAPLKGLEDINLDAIKLDDKFYIDIYKIQMLGLKEKALSGLCDIKDMTFIRDEIKRLEIVINEEENEEIVTFIKTTGSKPIVLPFGNGH